MEIQEHVQYHVLQIAFQTMKERCQQLQRRLSVVEKENASLQQQSKKHDPIFITKSKNEGEEIEIIQNQQKRIEGLKKYRSQLINHIHMLSSENRHLWTRLSKLMYANKSLDSQVVKTDDSTTKYKETFEFLISNANNMDAEDKEQSLEEISLCLINNSYTEKSELEQSCAEMIKLQTNTKVNSPNLGFVYPEDVTEESLEHLRWHDSALVKMKEILLTHQQKLNNILKNIKSLNKYKNYGCKSNPEIVMHQVNMPFNINNDLKENKTTQTTFSSLKTSLDKKAKNDNDDDDDEDDADDDQNDICPICGKKYKKSISFDLFHEHVVSHFTEDVLENLEIVS